MVHHIPSRFANRVRKNERALTQLSVARNPRNVLKKTNMVGSGFANLSKTVKQMFSLILDNKIPQILQGLSGSYINLMKKAVASRRPIEQSGSGIFTVLKHVIPVVLPMIMSLFKKKKN